MQEVLDKFDSLSVKDADCSAPEINIYKKIILPSELLNMYPEFLSYVLYLAEGENSLQLAVYTAIYPSFINKSSSEKLSIIKKYIKYNLSEEVLLDYILSDEKNSINVIIITDIGIKIKYIGSDICCILYKKGSIYYLLKKKGTTVFSHLCKTALIQKLFSYSYSYSYSAIIKTENIKEEVIKEEKQSSFSDIFDEVNITLDKYCAESYDVKMIKLMRLKLDTLKYSCTKKGLPIFNDVKNKYYTKKELCLLLLK